MSRMAPEGWSCFQLADLFHKFSSKGHVDKELLSVTQDRGVLPRSMLDGRVVSPDAGVSTYKLIEPGDFAVSLRSFQGGLEYSSYRGLISPAYTVLRPSTPLSVHFFKHYFKTPDFVERQLNKVTVGIRDGRQINIPDLLTLSACIPPLPEQKIIAAILNSVDEAISATQAVIGQARKVKEGLLQDLLTRGVGHTRFKQTKIGEIPERWEVVPLSQVATVQTGMAKNGKNVSDCLRMPYLRVANVQDGYLDLDEIKHIDVPKEKAERFLLQTGDVLVTEGGDYDKLGRGDVWHGQIERCVHQNHVFAVRPKAGIVGSEWLSCLFSSPIGKCYFQSCAKRTTNLASINSTQLKAFPVILPDIKEQKQLLMPIQHVSTSVLAENDKLLALREFKRGLMQDLLSGDVRVATS